MGSASVVYRARRAGHPGSMPVALKVALLPHDPRFEREVDLLSRFHHPARPQLLDRGWWHSSTGKVHPYLVMEWIRGLPLYDWERVHAPSQRQVLQGVAQLAWGLEVLHRANRSSSPRLNCRMRGWRQTLDRQGWVMTD